MTDLTRRVADRHLEASDLNLKRQGHRALVDLMKYLRLDPSDLRAEDLGRGRGNREKWSHPALPADIELMTYDYDPRRDEYVGSRSVNGHLPDGTMFTAGYDVDGLIYRSAPKAPWKVRVDGLPKTFEFRSMRYPEIAGKLKALGSERGISWAAVAGREIPDVESWVRGGVFDAEPGDPSLPEMDVRVKLTEVEVPLTVSRTPSGLADFIAGLDGLEWLEVEGERVDPKRIVKTSERIG